MINPFAYRPVATRPRQNNPTYVRISSEITPATTASTENLSSVPEADSMLSIVGNTNSVGVGGMGVGITRVGCDVIVRGSCVDAVSDGGTGETVLVLIKDEVAVTVSVEVGDSASVSTGD
jgi:hypothetical protein